MSFRMESAEEIDQPEDVNVNEFIIYPTKQA